jgi:hypothetical protein
MTVALTRRLAGAWRGLLTGWARPEAMTAPAATRDNARYRRSRDMALGIAWDDPAVWAALGAEARLYPRIRQFFNPVARVSRFYAAATYPGRIPEGTLPLPPGVREAIPLVGASDDLVTAIRQGWQWSQWQGQKSELVALTADLGEMFVEIVDDTARGRVAKRPWSPEHLERLDLDDYGNVVGYKLVYGTRDREGRPYVFGQEATKEFVRFTRDDRLERPNDFTEAEFDNPWGGLVPATWRRHRLAGRDVGLPAVLPSRLLAEIDGLTSRLADYLTKRFTAPTGLAYEGEKDTKGAEIRVNASEAFTFVELPDGTTHVPLAGDMDPSEAVGLLDRLLGEVADLYPEMTAYSKLREMRQVSGVAVEMLLGDVVNRLDDVQAAHDTQERKEDQMLVAIGGEHANDGTWGPRAALTFEQEAFLPFTLDSYRAGDLAFSIAPRPLVPVTAAEEIELEQKRYEALAKAEEAGVPAEVVMGRVGFSEDEQRRITVDRVAALERRQRLAASDLPMDGSEVPLQ